MHRHLHCTDGGYARSNDVAQQAWINVATPVSVTASCGGGGNASVGVCDFSWKRQYRVMLFLVIMSLSR